MSRTALPDRGGDSPLRIVVMDPLAERLSCPCVRGYAQRKYDRLGAFLGKRLGCAVRVVYGESLAEILGRTGGKADLIIGKQSVIVYDAAQLGKPVRPIAMLTSKTGSTVLTGLFVVRHDDPAQCIADLKGHDILFGPEWADEKHSTAVAAMKISGVALPEKIETSPGCNMAAVDVVEEEADAAVISSYAMPLLIGCETIDKGALRVIGKTAPVPFITAFVTDSVAGDEEGAILGALLAVGQDKTLLEQMESKHGFLEVPGPRVKHLNPAGTSSAPSPTTINEWTDWRGPGRRAISPDVPDRLPDKPKFRWRKPLTGAGLAGIAATSGYVILADKDEDEKNDIFRCLSADTGDQIWDLTYAAPGEMDYSNAPRANPVIHDRRVYLLGAFGHLHCVELATGHTIWAKNIVKDFGADLVTWGMCSPPLIVDDKLIVNPGAEDASLVALNRLTGEVIWKSPGEPAAYSSFIVGTFGGVRQVIGYDATSLGGWDPKSGKRLWKLVPPEPDDFNVPTPIDVDGRLLVATENNGTRLYAFNDDGTIRPKPVARNPDLAPDCSTPVVVDGKVFGCCVDLYCLDLDNGLEPLWTRVDDLFEEYASYIAGNDRVLITTNTGELILIRATGERYEQISRLALFDDADVWSHPALVGNRLYIRTQTEVVCLLLEEGRPD